MLQRFEPPLADSSSNTRVIGCQTIHQFGQFIQPMDNSVKTVINRLIICGNWVNDRKYGNISKIYIFNYSYPAGKVSGVFSHLSMPGSKLDKFPAPTSRHPPRWTSCRPQGDTSEKWLPWWISRDMMQVSTHTLVYTYRSR